MTQPGTRTEEKTESQESNTKAFQNKKGVELNYASKARERRSWALRGPAPGLARDRRENRKMVRMGSVCVARELQRTGRKGPRWERKPHPPGQKPEQGGRRPLGLGGVGSTRTGVGKKQHRATRPGEERGSLGLGILRTHETGEGSSARSSRVGARAV